MLRKRMEKQWAYFFLSQPTFTANWERGQTRTITQPTRPAPPKSKPRPKPKPKSKAKAPAAESTGDPFFEEIEFKTPPVTPPPKPLSPAKLPATVERDEEFWAFYDQAPRVK